MVDTNGGTDAAVEAVSISTTEASTTTVTTPPTTRPPRQIGRILLVGDSVADTISDALRTETRSRGLSYSDQTVSGCGMITGLPIPAPGMAPVPWAATCEKAILEYQPGLAAQRSAGTVLWLSSWETANRLIDGTEVQLGTPEGDAVILDLMEQTRARLLDGSDALLVLAKLAPPATTSAKGYANPTNTNRLTYLNTLFDRFAAAHPIDTTVLDLERIVCPSGPPCPAVIDGVTLRPTDGGHFSPEGATWVAPRLVDELLAVAS